ncbi:MAG TPA: ABC transporter ATP-binding protein [Acetobacteraceae bacterium]|nr:ABC transporter ATP-binding protein [Acetobacteraceae bacterium]
MSVLHADAARQHRYLRQLTDELYLDMLTVRGLTKIYVNRYDAHAGGVRDIAFSLPPGTFFTLLGPSGCGKTTTLRCVAGLERPDAGTITLGERVLFDGAQRIAVPMNQRGIGMVFQSYAIWPHMTVFENVAFPLRVAKQRRYPREEIRTLVDQALGTVGLAGYGDRPATRLSGGQQQRVALARAIVHHPQLLLLDEPLSNLDATLREEMRTELRRLQQDIGVTAIYVTHDQAEALAMSDVIAVMDHGRIVQFGAPRDIYFRPENEFVASFIGAANLLEGATTADVPAGGVGRVRLDSGEEIACTFPAGGTSGQAATTSIRPESISIVTSGVIPADGTNLLRGTVNAASFLGASVRYDVQVGQRMLRVIGPAEQALARGTAVSLTFAPQTTVSGN